MAIKNVGMIFLQLAHKCRALLLAREDWMFRLFPCNWRYIHGNRTGSLWLRTVITVPWRSMKNNLLSAGAAQS